MSKDREWHTDTTIILVLQEELKIAMQLLGITSLSEANLDCLNTTELESLLPSRMLYRYKSGAAKL